MYRNISTSDRVLRFLVSYLLIFTVVSSTGSLGAMAYLALISIYPGITALIGWDPVSALMSKGAKRVIRVADYAPANRLVTQ